MKVKSNIMMRRKGRKEGKEGKERKERWKVIHERRKEQWKYKKCRKEGRTKR